MLKITSRNNTLRIFKKLTHNIIEFQALDTLYYTGIGNNSNDLDGIEPDGGPLLQKGYTISMDKEEYMIKNFTNIIFDEDRKYLQALLHVKKVN